MLRRTKYLVGLPKWNKMVPCTGLPTVAVVAEARGTSIVSLLLATETRRRHSNLVLDIQDLHDIQPDAARGSIVVLILPRISHPILRSVLIPDQPTY